MAGNGAECERGGWRTDQLAALPLSESKVQTGHVQQRMVVHPLIFRAFLCPCGKR
jgi:hypothetical protein